MITLVTKENANRHAVDLARMFRLRHHVFIEDAEWTGICSTDGLEFDRFDTENASYLLAKSPSGDVIGLTRFLPTTKPHLNSEVFSELCDHEGVPRGESVWEASRLAVHPRHRFTASGQPVTMMLTCGWFEYALAYGISQLTLVTEAWRLSQMLEANWRVRPLGRTKKIAGVESVAVLIDVDRQILQNHYRYGRIVGPVITSGPIVHADEADAA